MHNARLASRWRIGLRGRYTLYSATLTTVLVLALTALSYLNARELVRGAAEKQLQHAATRLADQIGHAIGVASREVITLAEQPLFANAMLDSEGRNTYLGPFLARHKLPVNIEYNLVLVDYRGEPLVSRRALTSYAEESWLASAVEEGEAYAGIRQRDGKSLLRIGVPILYRLTGTHEGALVFETDLTRWLSDPASPFAEFDDVLDGVELLTAGVPIVSRIRRASGGQVHMSAPIRSDLPMELALSVRVAMDEAAFEKPLEALLAKHLWWGMLAVVLVTAASAIVARAQARRIEDLAEDARAIAHDGDARYALTAGRYGSDEIGDLANSLMTLLGELKSHEGELAALVERRTAELAAREADLNHAQSIARVGSWVFHPGVGQFALSAEARRICGVPDGQSLRFEDLLLMLHPEDRELMKAWRAGLDGGLYNHEHRLLVGSETRWVHVQAECSFDADGRVVRSVGTLQDVTLRRQTEARMREALVVFEASSQGIMTTDASGVIVSVNPAFCRITGYAVGEVVGRTPSVLRSGRHDAAFYRAMWSRLIEDGQWEGEVWNRRRSGELYPEWLTISAVRDVAGRIVEFVALFSDISERKEHEEVIWRQANFDALTGLANRSLLHDRMALALVQQRRAGHKMGLLFLDLDGFKWVNDTLGHNVGDELLIAVAQRLKGCVREHDTVARLGGDEFTIVVTGLHDNEVLRGIGEKVLAALREPFMLGGGSYHISGSVGITVFPDDGADVQTLLCNADIAMYKSKQTGKNRLHFYAPQMQADVSGHLEMQAELRKAIAAEAFVLEYQPIVDADSGELAGAEALIRWEHPERGRIAPAQFIPVAEECGLIVPIGEWALRTAARQWRSWYDATASDLRIAVNVSGVQFRDASLPPLVAEVIRECGIVRGGLVLEICESVLVDGSPQAQARMREIKAQGIGYALDDFGTGFSSLSYLKRFPVDVVKIDRSFVSGCPDDRNDAHLVEAIINMAHSLGLKVVAEGVETEAQVNFLRERGCDQLQGYLISKPVPAEEFKRLIDRHELLAPAERTLSPDTRSEPA